MNRKERLEALLAKAIALENECKDIIEIIDEYLGIIEKDEYDAKAMIEEPEDTGSFIFVEGE